MPPAPLPQNGPETGEGESSFVAGKPLVFFSCDGLIVAPRRLRNRDGVIEYGQLCKNEMLAAHSKAPIMGAEMTAGTSQDREHFDGRVFA